MTPCNAEYNESGNHDKHTHRCAVHTHGVDEVCHRCACGRWWTDAPAKPESRCICRIEISERVYLPNTMRIIRCAYCLAQDAEIQRLTQELRKSGSARINGIEDENARLTSALKVAVEALKNFTDANSYTDRRISRQALAAIAALEVKK